MCSAFFYARTLDVLCVVRTYFICAVPKYLANKSPEGARNFRLREEKSIGKKSNCKKWGPLSTSKWPDLSPAGEERERGVSLGKALPLILHYIETEPRKSGGGIRSCSLLRLERERTNERTAFVVALYSIVVVVVVVVAAGAERGKYSGRWGPPHPHPPPPTSPQCPIKQ